MTRTEVFWSKVERRGASECWPWLASQRGGGYGAFRFNGHFENAHRVAYQLITGTLLQSDVHVLHRCDNPPCCNPSHLFLGSNADNVRDKIAKGRQIRGEQINTNKLSSAQVLEIMSRRSSGETPRALAAEYDIRASVISNIMARRIWRHLTPPEGFSNPPRPRITHCKHGHEYTPANTKVCRDGWRSCRTCSNASVRRWHREQKR